jgi:hypothetical protein
MTDGQTDLAWFHALPLDDRLALLRDPYADLSPALMSRLPTGLVTCSAYWVAQGASSSRPKLSPSAAIQLEDQRDELMRDLDPDRPGKHE